MRRTSSTLATSLLIGLLAACGGGGSSDEPAEPVEAGGANSLLVIANSVTLRTANNGGAPAGTAPAGVTFADHTGSTIGVPVRSVDATALEVDPNSPVPPLATTDRTAVVVALGDNGVPARYAELLAAATPRARLACTSTWWENAARDAAIKAACEAAGGRFVYVGDVYPSHQAGGGLVGLAVDARVRAEVSARLVAALK